MTIHGEEWRAMDSGGAATLGGDDAIVAEAKRRIEAIRKVDATLQLTDRSGAPLAGTTVTIEQTASAFLVGDMTWDLERHHREQAWLGDQARYWRHHFEQVFNAATCLCYWTERTRNDAAKTEAFQGEPRYEGFAACVDWASSRGLAAKGHPLFWSIPKCIPDWAQRYDAATLMRFAEVRVRSLVARFRGRVRLWDAVNEPLWEASPANLARRQWPHIEPIAAIADYIEPVLRWCYAEDPDGCFVINDYGLEADAGGQAPTGSDGQPVTAARQRRRMIELVDELRQRGVGPGAIGMQAHTGGWIRPATQLAVYDELAEAGLPLHVTEFWASTHALRQAGLPQDEIDRRQADYIRDYLTVAFGHPAIEAFFFWGFMRDAIRWLEHSGHETTVLFDTLRTLLHQTWRTRLTLATDARGRVGFRGFLGNYALRTTRDGGVCRGVGFVLSKQQSGPIHVCVP